MMRKQRSIKIKWLPQVYTAGYFVVQLLISVWLCSPTDCSTPGFPVFHYLPEFAQTHVYWFGDAIQPSHHLLSPFSLQSFPASGTFLMSRHFTSGGQSIGASASVLPVNIQGWFPLELTALFSLQSKGFSRVFSSTTVWKHQFFTAQPSLWSNSHICKGQTQSPKAIFPSSALPQPFIWISVELSGSFCNVCIFCPHWVWFVLFLRTSTMIYWPLCPISLQIYSAPSVVLEPAGCLIDIFQISTPMNKACSF